MMSTTAELLLQTTINDLERSLEAERTCTRSLNVRIRSLEARLVTLHADNGRLTAQVARLEAELADLRAGIVAPPY